MTIQTTTHKAVAQSKTRRSLLFGLGVGLALAGVVALGGTAQKAENGGYSDTDYVASFIGFAPSRNPRLLVSVMVDEPRGEIYGGTVAAPAFEKIASFALPYLKIPPQ